MPTIKIEGRDGDRDLLSGTAKGRRTGIQWADAALPRVNRPAAVWHTARRSWANALKGAPSRVAWRDHHARWQALPA